MATVNEKMTALADEIRTLGGGTTALSIDDMTTEVSDANEEVTSQADLISQISAALEGKSAGGGSGSVETCTIKLQEGSQIFMNVGYTDGNMEYKYVASGLIDGTVNEITNVACSTILYLFSPGNSINNMSVSGGSVLGRDFRFLVIALDSVQNGGEIILSF